MTEALAALTAPMIQTFAALLLAHVLADFTFQTDWIVRHKRNPLVLLLHIVVVFGFTTAALGGIWELALVIAAAHLVIDAVKLWALPRHISGSFAGFAADQTAHLATLCAAAIWFPGAVAAGTWAAWLGLLTAPELLLSGLIVTVTAGGYAVGLLTARFSQQVEQRGMADAGRLIGQLERALVFLLVMIEQPAGIGFLIAAKSILRFDTAREDHKASEYVIIGTLASVTWALLASYATRALLEIAATVP
jgi:hypothetical protein